MKLSDLSTDRALDVLCEILPNVNSICIDEEMVEAVKKKISKKFSELSRAEILLIGAEKLTEIGLIALKKHRHDVLSILAAINGVEPEQVERQNIIKTMTMLRELAKDEELIAFFRSCAERDGSGSQNASSLRRD